MDYFEKYIIFKLTSTQIAGNHTVKNITYYDMNDVFFNVSNTDYINFPKLDINNNNTTAVVGQYFTADS